MLNLISSNHGDDGEWKNSIREDGTMRQRPIYARSTTGSSIGLDLEDIDALVKARDELLAVQAEVQAELAKPKLPTEPGLYVLSGVYYVLKPGGQWTVLWENHAENIHPQFRTEADMLHGIGSGNISDMKRVGA